MFKKKQTPAKSGEYPGTQIVKEPIGQISNVNSNTGIVGQGETFDDAINRIEAFAQTMHDEVSTVLNTMADRIVALEENRNPEMHERNTNQRISVLEQNVLGGQNIIQSVVNELNALISDYTDLREKVLLQKKYRTQAPTTVRKKKVEEEIPEEIEEELEEEPEE